MYWAQIVTKYGGPAWRQTIYFPFMHASCYGKGMMMDMRMEAPTYETKSVGPVPLIEAAAVHNEKNAELVIFAVNRSQDEEGVLRGSLKGFQGYKVREHIVLEHEDPKAVNTEQCSNLVVPHAEKVVHEDDAIAVLPKLSWNVVRLQKV